MCWEEACASQTSHRQTPVFQQMGKLFPANITNLAQNWHQGRANYCAGADVFCRIKHKKLEKCQQSGCLFTIYSPRADIQKSLKNTIKETKPAYQLTIYTHLLGWHLSSRKSLFLPANQNKHQERFQLFRDFCIHINEAIEAPCLASYSIFVFFTVFQCIFKGFGAPLFLRANKN